MSRAERLEAEGWSWGRTGAAESYRHPSWSKKEAEAFQRGYENGKAARPEGAPVTCTHVTET